MEIKGQPPRLNVERRSVAGEKTPLSGAKRESDHVEATGGFQSSGRVARVRAAIEELVSSPEVRADVVQQARARLAAGELDTPEAFLRAAEGFLG